MTFDIILNKVFEFNKADRKKVELTILKNHDIPMALRAAYLSMHRQTNAYLAHHNITADQFVCLSVLEDEDGITQQQLAKRAISDPNTISAMLVLLENRGLISRRPHPEDRRAYSVKLTTTGKILVDELSKSVEPVQKQLLAPFSNKESKNLLDLLNRIASSMSRIPNNKKKPR